MSETMSGKRHFSGVIASRIAESNKKKRYFPPHNRQICPHCNQCLTMKTFLRHRKLYCTASEEWIVDTKEAKDDLDDKDNEGMYIMISTKCV